MPASEYALLSVRVMMRFGASSRIDSPFHPAKSAYASSRTSGDGSSASASIRSAGAVSTVPDGEFGLGTKVSFAPRAHPVGAVQPSPNRTASNRAP